MIRAARGCVLVRRAETEETIPGGKIFLPQDTREKMAAYQVEIVDVGPPDVCENEVCTRDHDSAYRSSPSASEASFSYRVHRIPESVKPGAWAIVRPRSFIAASHDDKNLYFVRCDDVYAVFQIAR